MTVSRGTAIKSRPKICNSTTIIITEDKNSARSMNDFYSFVTIS